MELETQEINGKRIDCRYWELQILFSLFSGLYNKQNIMLMFIMSVTYIHVVWQTHFLVGFDDKTHPRTNTLAHKMCVFSTSKTVYCTRMNVHTIIDERWFSGIVKWFSDCINALRCLVVLIISVYKLLRLVDFKVEQSRSAVIDLSLSLSLWMLHTFTHWRNFYTCVVIYSFELFPPILFL